MVSVRMVSLHKLDAFGVGDIRIEKMLVHVEHSFAGNERIPTTNSCANIRDGIGRSSAHAGRD